MLNTAQPYSQPHIDTSRSTNGVAQEAYRTQLEQQRLIDFHLSEQELNRAASPNTIELDQSELPQDPRYTQALGAEAARIETSLEPESQVGSPEYIAMVGNYLEMTRDQFVLGA